MYYKKVRGKELVLNVPRGSGIVSSSTQIDYNNINNNPTVRNLLASGSISSGSICYVYTSGSVKLANNSNSANASKLLYLAKEDISHNTYGEFISYGNSGNIYSGLNVSNVLYLDESGRPTDIAPTGSSVLRVIGYADTTSSIHFNPSPDWFQLAEEATQSVALDSYMYFYAGDNIQSGSIGTVSDNNIVKLSSNLNELSSSGMLVLAKETVTSGSLGSFLVFGQSGDVYTSLTPYKVLYLDENGRPTATSPSTGNTFMRVVGYSLDASSIYFSPSQEWFQISSGSDYNLLDSKWQVITSSAASVGSIDLSTYNHVKVLMNGNFDTTYINTSSMVESIRHMFIFKTDGSNRTINNGHPSVFDNFGASFILSGSERGMFEMLKDIDGDIMFSGGPVE